MIKHPYVKLMAVSLLCATSMHASGSGIWNGSTSTAFDTASNWTDGGSLVGVPAGNTTYRDSDLLGAANTTVSLDSDNTYNFSFFFQNTLGSQNSYTLDGPGFFNWGGSILQTSAVTVGSITDVLAANLSFGNGTVRTFDLGANHNLDVTGAMVNSGVTGATIIVSKTGAGTLIQSGTNTYLGATTVSAGTLLVNGDNSAAIGAVTVETGATLGGSGTIGGATTVESGAFLAAGNSPGVLTFVDALTLSAGSTTVMEIAGTVRGTEYDGFDVGGLLTIDGELIITSDDSIAPGVYDLFGISGSVTGDFDTVALSGLVTGTFLLSGDIWTVTVGGLTYSLSQVTGDLTVVPESGTYALIGGLLALGVVMIRRRR